MKNIYELFHKSYMKFPFRPYVFDQENWTYEKTFRYIKATIKLFTEKKIKPNDKVVIYMENTIEYIILYFAILYKGAIVIPVSPANSVENITEILEDCQPQFVITFPHLLKKIEEAKGADKFLIISFSINSLIEEDYENIPQMKTGKLAMIIYTSGTTSKPKGVMLTHKNLIENTFSILDYLHLTHTDSILAIMSFTYSYGNSVMLTHTKVGAMLYLYKAIYPQNILKMLQNGQFTGFSTVGSYLNVLLKQENFSEETFKNINYITLAGEQTSKKDLMKLYTTNKNLKIFVMYGQTEASARLTFLPPSMLCEKLGSVGKAIKNVTIKIINDNGEEVSNSDEGEICAKGMNIMQGYLNNPIETDLVLKEGWLHTGDIGYKDSEGYLYITGRKKDIIKYRGYRISPTEIENIINSYEGILESAVTESQNEDMNEIIAAIVRKPDMLSFDFKLLCHKLKESLPRYKIPKKFFVVKEIPKTSNGKIKRKELKKILLKIKEKDIYYYDI